jgi:hypothetical protein
MVAIVDIWKNNNAPKTAPFQRWYALIKPELHGGAFKGRRLFGDDEVLVDLLVCLCPVMQ